MSLHQIYAIVWRNLLIMIRRLKINIVLVFSPFILFLLIKLILKGSIKSKIIPGMIIVLFQLSLLRKTTAFFVRERAKKFLATYKLMGLKQSSYTLGMLLSFYLLSVVSLVPNLVLYVPPFNFYKELNFQFWVCTVLFCVAATNYGVFFSVFIRNPSFASEMSSLLTFSLIMVSLLSLLGGFQKYSTILLYTIPHNVYVKSLWAFDVKQKEEAAKLIPQYMAILSLQAVAAYLLYIYFSQVVPDEFGLTRSWLFPLEFLWKKKRAPESTQQITEGQINPLDTSFEMSEISGSESNRSAEENELKKAKQHKNPDSFDQNQDLKIKNVAEIIQLTKKYGKNIILDKINFKLKEGQITSLLGHNGAGKSTLVNILCGIIKPTQGTIKIQENPLSDIYQELVDLVGYCPSYNVVYGEMTVQEHLKFVSMLKGVPIRSIKQKTDQLLRGLGMDSMVKTKISQLSGGSLRKLTLASALVNAPKILILDEPTNGVDVHTRAFVWDYLKLEVSQRKTSILLTTHHLQEAEKVSDYIYIIAGGKIKANGKLEQLTKKLGVGDKLIIKSTKLGLPGAGSEFSDNQIEQEDADLVALIKQIEEWNSMVTVNTLQEGLKYEVIIPLDERLYTKDILAMLEKFNKKAENAKIDNIAENEDPGENKGIEQEGETQEGLNDALTHEDVSEPTKNCSKVIYSIHSNSLENIIIKTTEEEFQTASASLESSFNSELSSKLDKLLETTKNSITSKSRYRVIIKRRLLLLFKNPVQLFSFILYIVFPWLICLTVARNKGAALLIASNDHALIVLIIIIVDFLLLICSFFGIIIVYERNRKLRFYLKINNINSKIYLAGTLIADVLVGMISIVLILTGSILIVNHQSKKFNLTLEDLKKSLLILAPWMASFILQHYFIAGYLSKTTQVTSYTNMIIILASLFSFLFLKSFQKATKLSPWLINEVFYVMNPISLIHMFSFNELKKKDKAPKVTQDLDFWGVYIRICVSVVVWFVLCLIQDWVCNYRQSGTKSDALSLFGVTPEINGGPIEKFRPDLVDQELERVNGDPSGAVRTQHGGSVNVDVLKVKNLKKSFSTSQSTFYAVYNFCLGMGQGEVFGLLGPNGSGKTTIFKILCTYHRRDSGEILFKGGKNMNKMLKSTGLCFQDDILWENLSVWDHLKLVGGLKGVKSEAVMKEWLDLFGLTHSIHKKAYALSTGMKRKLGLILAMISQPELLFLDEISSGLDPHYIRVFNNLAIKMSKKNNTSILYTTHSLKEAERICDRVAILIRGQTSCVGSISQLKESINGYKIQVNLTPEQAAALNAAEFVQQYGNLIARKSNKLYIQMNPELKLSAVYGQLDEMKIKRAIDDFWISEKNLNDVFEMCLSQELDELITGSTGAGQGEFGFGGEDQPSGDAF